MQPGDYYLVAVNGLEPGRQSDPDFLKTLGSIATRVTVGDGVTLVQDLQVEGR